MNREQFEEYLIDTVVGIETVGRNDRFADRFRYPYEPTAYSVLDRIVDEAYLTKEDWIVDYGSGLGRVPIYLCERIGCRGTGVEVIPAFVEAAEKNRKRYGREDLISFVCESAERWEVPDGVTGFFFFNPFDVKILRGVMQKILASYERRPREMRLMFYYPQDEYVGFLMGIPQLRFEDEIDCMDLFPNRDERNKILLFEIG